MLTSSWTHLTLFLPVTTFVICSLIPLCSEVAYIAEYMDLDQTAPIVVAPITQAMHVCNKNSYIQGRSLNVIK